MKNELILEVRHQAWIINEIHALIPEIFAFKHILTDLAILVNPGFQGSGPEGVVVNLKVSFIIGYYFVMWMVYFF